MGVPMAKAVVTNLTKAWGAVSIAQERGQREGGALEHSLVQELCHPMGKMKNAEGKRWRRATGTRHLPVTWGQGCWRSIPAMNVPANLPKTRKKGGSYLFSVSKGFNVIPGPPGHLP